ncbi:SMRCD-like protein [Mya arenaria]|uniref:DNA helicase n=1 Tax=Mya arenaria TaxID=6604 RepID=A0ABY7EJL0_MYAAR|nr:SMRCD-like protein [Mya arenaria]
MSQPTKRLTSLLQYRFVKKEKSASGSDSSQEISLSSQETASPSQISTQPPSTPDKTPLSINTTPDSKGRLISPVSSPDSPIFTTRPRLMDRHNGTPEKPASPWLSKENGTITNGASTSNRRQLARFPSDSDEDVSEVADTAVNLASLRPMFPSLPEEDVRQALMEADGNVEKAIDVLIDLGRGKKKQFKRIRPASQESTSPDVVTQPRKRIRQISSDSGEETSQNASQSTVGYSLESQRSDVTVVYDVDQEELPPPTADQKKKINFLSGCFSNKSKTEIHRTLADLNWNVGDATVTLSSTTTLKSITTENKVRAKAAASLSKTREEDLDDDEDEDYSGGEESDDSIEEEGDSGKSVILKFFEEATLEELMATPGCSKKKSELIVSHRPLKTWENMLETFLTVKGLSYDLISGCREVIKIRQVIVRLMKKCEDIASNMQKVVSDIIHSNTQVDDTTQITIQPKTLNPEIMHQQELNGILADEMGLGKTIQTISFLAHLLEEGEAGPHVIIVPSSTIDNWIRECKVWCPALKIVVYYGSQEERRATRQYIMYNKTEDFNVIITTYNMASGSVEDRTLFKKFEFHYAIFDEGHLLKNMTSIRYQSLMKISAYRRLLLTGTPLQNNLLELMSLLCFVMPDIFMGKTEQLKRMFTMISKTNSDEKRSRYEQDRIAQAKKIMTPFVLRRLKSEVMSQLPKKSEEVIYCDMLPEQATLYNSLVTNFSKQVSEGSTDMTSRAGASMLMQLRKAANHPLLHRSHYTDAKVDRMAKDLCQETSHMERGAIPKFIAEDMREMSDFELNKTCQFYKSHLKKYLLDDSLIRESGKFQELDRLLDDHSKRGHRVLIFSQFTSVLDIMEVFLTQKHIRYTRLDGSTPVPERQRLIDEFNTDTEIFVFLLSTRAGGLGINLTSANVVILHDIDFNPYNDKQAEDRCHRVGQIREVQIVRLISRETVDEGILKCSLEKLKLEKEVISTDGQDDEQGNTKNVASILKQALHVAEKRSAKS